MKRMFFGAFLVVASFVLGARVAYGVPMIRLSDGLGNMITLADGGAVVGVGIFTPGVDLSPVAGAVTYSGVIGNNWVVNVSTGINSGTPTHPNMDLNSVDQSIGAGTLTIQFTDTGFGPLTQGARFNDDIGGTTNGTVSGKELYDAGNNPFGVPTGIIIATLGPFGPGAFSASTQSLPVPGVAPFSLTQVVTITHTGAGVTSFDWQKSVSEPGSLMLLGSGLVGFCYLSLRRRRG